MASGEKNLEGLTSWSSDWSNFKVAVIGLGKTGFSVADTLNELGSKLLVLTQTADEKSLDILDVLGVEVVVSENTELLLEKLAEFDADLAIISPGIAPSNPLPSYLSKLGIKIWTDVDLAWRLRDRFRQDQKWICITGTNGKTTTTEITEAMLLAGGVKAVACGNIGKPILDCIRDPADFEVLVVELSSYQLHYLDEISPYSSAVLNVAEDHLDWHGGLENYRLSKGRIYQNTQVACVYNLADPVTERLVEHADVMDGARAIGFSLSVPAPSNVGYVDEYLVDRAFLEDRSSAALEIASIEDLSSFGVLTPHLLENIAAATALARSIGISPADCLRALRSFHISPHRIELIAEADGVRYINDSKATNAHAAAASLQAFESVVWVLGGLLKGVDIAPLIQRFAPRLRGVVVIGHQRGEIMSAFAQLEQKVPVVEISNEDEVMSQAVRQAALMAKGGDVVLLAPAAASMDQFRDYQDRGDSFRRAVEEMLANK